MTDASSSEVVYAAADAAAAVERAREEQLRAANLESEKRIAETFTNALKDAFKEAFDEQDGERRYLDITRIPLICKDIAQIKLDQSDMKDNLKWGVRVVMGAVIMGVLGLLFIK